MKVAVVGAELSSAAWDERNAHWVTAAGLPLDFEQRRPTITRRRSPGPARSYCRVTVTDVEGRRAWSNPIWP